VKGKTLVKPRPYDRKEEFARRGNEIYERDVRLHVETGDEGKFVRSTSKQGPSPRHDILYTGAQ
jgi:hypothetical protein